ncbi:hypothetical protein SAMN02745176_00313 [Lutispora thermophila DSM 19022]|uniref:Uncharacterized protein n=1 Tax=Lutispora thermophila DSM 19022 TaxID=1122184 RepID=A0A1M6B7H0_9FIRM|nr:hypothetical protein SAMN02745176_00313 [Lutispora thermophila DSM 19022]
MGVIVLLILFIYVFVNTNLIKVEKITVTNNTKKIPIKNRTNFRYSWKSAIS